MAEGANLESSHGQEVNFKIPSQLNLLITVFPISGVSIGPDNLIVVADSSNHRVQVFDATGNFFSEFGTYGNGDGEFDCLAGVAINRIGQYIIADRYNHRIQVFDPSGQLNKTCPCFIV